MTKTKRFFRGTIWLIVVVSSLAGTVQAQGVAMVLSASGKTEVVKGTGNTRVVRPMLVLEKGDVLTTGEDGTVLFVLFSDSLEYTIGAEGRVLITAAKLDMESGALKVSPKQAKLKLPTDYSLSSRKLMGKMIRDQQVAKSYFLNPPNFAQIRAGSLQFQWKLAGSAKTVVFSLYGPNDEELLNTEVTGNSISFPPHGMDALKPGGHYFTEVYDTAAPSGSESGRAQSEFRVMTTEEVITVEAGERRVLELLKNSPIDPAPLMELMILYLHHKLYADAIATGERLQMMLPDNPELLHIQAGAMTALGLVDQAQVMEKRAAELEKIQ